MRGGTPHAIPQLPQGTVLSTKQLIYAKGYWATFVASLQIHVISYSKLDVTVVFVGLAGRGFIGFREKSRGVLKRLLTASDDVFDGLDLVILKLVKSVVEGYCRQRAVHHLEWYTTCACVLRAVDSELAGA